jgi:hypothetical protein
MCTKIVMPDGATLATVRVPWERRWTIYQPSLQDVIAGTAPNLFGVVYSDGTSPFTRFYRSLSSQAKKRLQDALKPSGST